jgi:hypothetical protein
MKYGIYILAIYLLVGCGQTGALLQVRVKASHILNSQEVSQINELVQGEGDLTFKVDSNTNEVIVEKLRR